MDNPPIRRFLAGVACPSCDQVDTVRVFTVSGTLWRDCVACGLEESVDQSRAEDTASIEVVRIMQPQQKPEDKK